MRSTRRAYLLPGGAFVGWKGGFFEDCAAVDVAQSEGLGVRMQVIAPGIAVVTRDAVGETGEHGSFWLIFFLVFFLLLVLLGSFLVGELFIGAVLLGAFKRTHIRHGLLFGEGLEVTRHCWARACVRRWPLQKYKVR